MAVDPLSISQTSFRSRRSYPNLNHVSLAPLTPRFPIDDLSDEAEGYFVDRGDHPDSANSQHQQHQQWTRSSSYLSSSSVPGTPGVLSESRSASRARHHKRTRSTHKSETNLQRLGGVASDKPRHRRGRSDIGIVISPEAGGASVKTSSASRSTERRDSEWLLRAGLALATSTREEKGQSWISKRESSTNLVADNAAEILHEDNLLVVSPSSSRIHAGRASRSGRSTPAAMQSRRSSRSRGGSRRASRHDLSMTPTAAAATTTTQKPPSLQMMTTGPGPGPDLPLPDFVDAHIRAEMEALQVRRYLEAEGKSHEGSEDEDFSSSMGDEDDDDNSDSGDDYDDEMDEAEFQRLTRERGFGLGSWIDHYIGWALFGVDEEYSSATAAPPDAIVASRQRISFNHPAAGGAPAAVPAATEQESAELSGDEDDHGDTPDEPAVPIESPGEQGGWADANWLFRLARRTLV